MKRSLTVACAAILTLLGAWAPGAQAELGLIEPNVTFTSESGGAEMQAGSHPFATTISFGLDAAETENGIKIKDVIAELPPGFIGNPTATPRCTGSDFADVNIKTSQPACPDSTALGLIALDIAPLGTTVEYIVPVYNLVPPPGRAVKLGFVIEDVPVVIEGGLSEAPPYLVRSGAINISQAIDFFGSKLVLWGNPASPVHDPYRGHCLEARHTTHGEPISLGECSVSIAEVPFITLPTSCRGPQPTLLESDYWQVPGPPFIRQVVETNDGSTSREPVGFNGCARLGFSPSIAARPTSKAATSPSGLDFSLDFEHNEGILNPSEEAVADSDVEKAVVTLPEGFSVNPSQAEGLNVCSEADLARENSTSSPGAGCPEESKIGTVEVETPVLEESVDGTLYVATPYENPAHSLIALYLVLQNEKLGISVHQTLRVQTDPATGQITTVAEEIPQLPFSHFRLHFREGTRSPLATPPGCGSYDALATLYPYSGTSPVTTTSTFEIITGPDAGPCPSGGTPPFHPGLIAGSINNAAGHYSPFDIRLFRADSEQEITHFSIKLPPGVTGKLAGIPFCSDLQIDAATAREGQPHGGQEELDNPSCPAASEVGHTLVGAGVGPSLTYVRGKVYLAGPYHGDSLSVVAITAAKAGPFDLGTVVVREGLEVNPETAEVFVDATGSDPIPHIIDGIPVHLRDIRVYVDRPDFVLNPTGCEPTSTASTVLGSGTDFASEADDRPVTVTTRYQAADCASLGYKPRVQLKLKGSTKRAGNPALTAILRPRPNDANSQKISVALPHSEFLDQGHIKTICTRVQFKAGAGNGTQCPAASVYGHAKAWTPLLAEPLEGPVFLRSSEHPLPDLVLALHGLIDFDAVGRVDSVHGGLRNSFETVPDAPISKVELRLGGGKKSLLENSVNLCVGSHKATAKYTGQNGKTHSAKVPLQASGCKKHHRKSAKSRGKHRRPLLERLIAW